MDQIDEQVQNDERIYYNLLKRVGVYGNYQINLLRIIYVITVISASTFFIVPFLFYQDSYQCPNYDGDCDKMVCSLPNNQRNQYLPQTLIKSLANYNTDMHCDNRDSLILMQQMFLIGTTIGLFVGIVFIEFLGKKMLIGVSLILTSVSLIMLFIQSNYIKGIALFVWGMGSQVSYSILLVLITQQIAQEHRLQEYISSQFWFIIGIVANCIVFYVFKDWKLVVGLYFIPSYIIVSVIFMYYVQDSPLDLVSRQSAEGAFNAFMRIAKRNQIQNHGLTLEQIVNLQQQYKQNQKKKHNYIFNFFDLFKYPSVRGDFLVLSLIFFICMFELYGPSFLLDQLKMNIFVLGFINGGSQLIAFFFAKEIITSYPRKKSQIILYTLAAILSFVTFLLAPNDCFNCNHSWKLAFTLLAFFGYRICINISSFALASSNNQSFPAQIRSLSIYSIVGVGRISTVLIPYQTKFRERFGISLLLQFSILCLFGILGSILMKQTWKQFPEEIILQLKAQKQNKQIHTN